MEQFSFALCVEALGALHCQTTNPTAKGLRLRPFSCQPGPALHEVCILTLPSGHPGNQKSSESLPPQSTWLAFFIFDLGNVFLSQKLPLSSLLVDPPPELKSGSSGAKELSWKRTWAKTSIQKSEPNSQPVGQQWAPFKSPSGVVSRC